MKSIKLKYLPDDADLRELYRHSPQLERNGSLSNAVNRNINIDDAALLVNGNEDLENSNYQS